MREKNDTLLMVERVYNNQAPIHSLEDTDTGQVQTATLLFNGSLEIK